MATQYCSLLTKRIESTIKITVHDESNTFLISRRTGLENHGSRLLVKSRFTARGKKQAISHFTEKKLGHSRITKIPSTIIMSVVSFRIASHFCIFLEADGKSRRKMAVNSQQIWSDCYHRNTRNSDMQCHSRNYKLDIHRMPQLTKQKLNLSIRKI